MIERSTYYVDLSLIKIKQIFYFIFNKNKTDILRLEKNYSWKVNLYGA